MSENQFCDTFFMIYAKTYPRMVWECSIQIKEAGSCCILGTDMLY